MRVAIASGKGGTGKTTVATNLAWVAAEAHRAVAYLDCDVEEPNGHVFLRPVIASERPVTSLVPEVDLELCTRCGLCGEICRYSAILCLGDQVLLFPNLCHSCGGCSQVCVPSAITESARSIGTLTEGTSNGIRCVQGLLEVGEAMSPPVIRAVKDAVPAAELVIVDAPPGTSCPVIESIRGSDYVMLVTEPTPFGLHDLELAVEMVRAVGIPCGVIVNRSTAADSETEDYCRAQGLEILARLPDERRIAEAYSRGELAAQAIPEYRSLFQSLLREIEAVCELESAS